MRNVLLASKYAAAIFEIAVTSDKVRPVFEELEQFSAALAADEQVFQFFSDPTTPAEEKSRVFQDVIPKLGLSEECAGLCQVMIANGRMGILPDVVCAFSRMVDEFEGRMDAQVTAAHELRPGEEERLRAALSALTKKTVTLKVEVDRSLIGGVVARVGNTVIDGSVSGRLAVFAETVK